MLTQYSTVKIENSWIILGGTFGHSAQALLNSLKKIN